MKRNNRMTGFCLFLLLGILHLAAGQALGDVNNDGAVTIVDALMIAQRAVGLNVAGFYESAADVNVDGAITIVDALITAQYYVGLISTLPPGGSTPVDNPFAGASWYVDAGWAANAAAGGGAAVAGYNTGVWITRIADITGGMGIAGHLDAALAQHANLILFILRDFPLCTNNMMNSDFYSILNFVARYKSEFIDPIAALFANPRYAGLRIVVVLEPQMVANLVTNLSIAACQEMNGSGGYVECMQYALNKFAALPNVYNYVDIANSAWLGWDSNFQAAVTVYGNMIKGTTRGVASVAGFITNTATYNPVQEPFLPDSSLVMGGSPIRSAVFYEWNKFFDEASYANAFYAAFVQAGFPSSIGMLIDTSRNGWGGAARPLAVSTSTDLETYVNESRIDKRSHRGNWCNVLNAGLGERPRANPASHIDAFVWAKPPGISDGVSSASVIDPNDPAKIFNLMCDPNGKSVYNSLFSTDAMPAPHEGKWNQAHFDVLLRNAHPPLN